MAKADSPAGISGQSSPLPTSADLVILGGGIMGLWAAVKAERLGIKTLLIDAGTLGQGASGGLLGALMSYMPDRWDAKKQFQFEALLALESEIAELEAETDMPCGYRRSGRLIPMPKPHLRKIALRHSSDAEIPWRQVAGRPFFWNVLDTPPDSSWVDPEYTEGGLVHETFAARVSPRGLTSALTAFLRASKHVQVVENLAVERIDATSNTVRLADGMRINFGDCIVAAGHRSFPLLEAVSPPLQKPLGQPVKGQAALLKLDIDPALPVVFLNGIYIVPHENGHVAIGSTSEDRFDDAHSTDALLDDLITRARKLSPMLEHAPVVERWAGLRPKAVDRDPMVGPHPDHPHLVALTGGFKVSFGMAHRLADAALDALSGRDMGLPSGFTFENHLEVASRIS